jgi:hypothetical protein
MNTYIHMHIYLHSCIHAYAYMYICIKTDKVTMTVMLSTTLKKESFGWS